MSDKQSEEPGPSEGSQRDRFEEVVEQAEGVAEEWSGRAIHWLARAAVRAREEAEDIWAEAQAKYRGQ